MSVGFWSHISNFFKELLGDSAKWEHSAQVVLAASTPLAVELGNILGGPEYSTEVAGVASQINQDIATASKVLKDAAVGDTTASAQLNDALASASKNLPAILQDVGVKNSSKASQVTTLTQTLIAGIESITGAIAAARASTAPAPGSSGGTPVTPVQ